MPSHALPGLTTVCIALPRSVLAMRPAQRRVCLVFLKNIYLCAGPVTGSGKVPSKRLSSGDVASKVGMAAKTGSLSLSASKLSATPSIIFTLTALRKLDLSHNGLTSLSPTDAASTPSFAALVNLRTLDLSHNKLTELSPALAALTLLVTVSRSGCSLRPLCRSYTPHRCSWIWKLTV